MSNPVNLSADDLRIMAQLQFKMLAETWAALSEVDPERSAVKMSVTIDGVKVVCAIATERMEGAENG